MCSLLRSHRAISCTFCRELHAQPSANHIHIWSSTKWTDRFNLMQKWQQSWPLCITLKKRRAFVHIHTATTFAFQLTLCFKKHEDFLLYRPLQIAWFRSVLCSSQSKQRSKSFQTQSGELPKTRALLFVGLNFLLQFIHCRVLFSQNRAEICLHPRFLRCK